MGEFNGMAEQTAAEGVPEDVAMAEQFHEHLDGARKRIHDLEAELERTRRVARALESALGQLEAPPDTEAGAVYVAKQF